MPMQDVLHSQRRNQSAQLLRQAPVVGTMMEVSRKTAGRNLHVSALVETENRPRDTGQGIQAEGYRPRDTISSCQGIQAKGCTEKNSWFAKVSVLERLESCHDKLQMVECQATLANICM